jgi:hypothetical protein
MNLVAPYNLIAKYKGEEEELIKNNTGAQENKMESQVWLGVLTDARTHFEQGSAI